MNFLSTSEMVSRRGLYIRFFPVVVLAFAAMSQPGCKSKKKLAQEQAALEAAAKEADIEKAKTALMDLLTNTSMDLDEKERRLNAIIAKNIEDDEVEDLIKQVEEMIAAERIRQQEEQRLREEELAKQKASEEVQRRNDQINGYFGSVSGAANREDANSAIQTALNMFSSPDAPVLVIIKETRNNVDYDRPTTIEKYLNYLKDTGNTANNIKEMKLDDNGKISELILTKE